MESVELRNEYENLILEVNRKIELNPDCKYVILSKDMYNLMVKHLETILEKQGLQFTTICGKRIAIINDVLVKNIIDTGGMQNE